MVEAFRRLSSVFQQVLIPWLSTGFRDGFLLGQGRLSFSTQS